MGWRANQKMAVVETLQLAGPEDLEAVLAQGCRHKALLEMEQWELPPWVLCTNARYPQSAGGKAL